VTEKDLLRSGTPLLMRITRAAAVCDLHPDVIWRWIRSGRVRAFGRPGSYRVCIQDLMPPVETPEKSSKIVKNKGKNDSNA
jgi:hypothetical protein